MFIIDWRYALGAWLLTLALLALVVRTSTTTDWGTRYTKDDMLTRGEPAILYKRLRSHLLFTPIQIEHPFFKRLIYTWLLTLALLALVVRTSTTPDWGALYNKTTISHHLFTDG